ncbi:unnamed protein product [Larinioides sclopetarius]|uniref:RRM domain-containing protein n=1 Tax=Larinioides sclopetarius TaxID=280406 RepID=A0AAV2ACU9_9ARAC
MQMNKKVETQGKVFLGGLPPDITETDIRKSLCRFGKVNQVTIICDQETKKCRGFGFICFEREHSIRKLCAKRFVNINRKWVECERAVPRFTNQRRNPAQGFLYGSGNQSSRRSGGYGPLPRYQAGWNSPPQPHSMQGQGYSNYQDYNIMGANSSSSRLTPHGSGNQDSKRSGGYGPLPRYQAGWNSPPQPHSMKEYGNYQDYNVVDANSSPACSTPYSAMQTSTQYAAQLSYGTVGYGNALPPDNGNYSQPSTSSYSRIPFPNDSVEDDEDLVEDEEDFRFPSYDEELFADSEEESYDEDLSEFKRRKRSVYNYLTYLEMFNLDMQPYFQEEHGDYVQRIIENNKFFEEVLKNRERIANWSHGGNQYPQDFEAKRPYILERNDVECKRTESRASNQRRNTAEGNGSDNQNSMSLGVSPNYQAGWNYPPQTFGMQGQGYDNYRDYNAMGANSSSSRSRHHGSGNQNSKRSGGYGSPPGYQAGLNQLQHHYNMQGPNYQVPAAKRNHRYVPYRL